MIQALIIAGFSFFNPGMPVDSLGVQTIDGKIFVIHKVDEKETLYSLSRRYGTTVDEIIKYNAHADAGLEIGRILKIPYVSRSVKHTQEGGAVHTVQDKETLYSISRLYNVSVDDIKKWNSLSDNSISVGQELTIKKTNTATAAVATPATSPQPKAGAGKGTHQVASQETLYGISRQYDVSVDNLRQWNNLQGNDLKVGQILYVAPPNGQTAPVAQHMPDTKPATQVPPKETTPVVEKQTEKEPVKETPVTPQRNVPEPQRQTDAKKIVITESMGNSDEVVESGIAELIEGTEANRKYLALHRTAPVGTILKVRNEMNNREVFVRVMGKLPDTGLNNKLLIKISKSAYDRLGAIDSRFRVQVTYYK